MSTRLDGAEIRVELLTDQFREPTKALMNDYARWLGFDLGFQRFDEEMRTFPARYAEPSGCVVIALLGEKVVGCVALRGLEPGVCEMKRLYVSEEFQGRGIGHRLVERILDEGRARGYRTMRLDTSRDRMASAMKLYVEYGFHEIEAYTFNPLPDATYFEADLTGARP